MERAAARGWAESIHGIEMYCRERGEGEPLLLLHGFTGSGADWELIFPEPPAGWRLIAPDLCGHGRSTNPAGRSASPAAPRSSSTWRPAGRRC
jgi:pimeloyl-ACP methyl ester carboxylesterase